MYHVSSAFQFIYECSNEGSEDEDGKEGSKILGTGERMEIAWCLFYPDDMVLCGELENWIG